MNRAPGGEATGETGPRLLVIGGSSADGFGVGDGESYASTWSRTLDLPLSMHIKYGLRARDVIELLAAASPSHRDVIVVHLGFVDATPVLPPTLRRLFKRLKRGRGKMEAASTDRRLYSRVRRKTTHTLEQSLTVALSKLRLLVPVQDVQSVRRHYAALESRLARFEGQLICVLSEHAPQSPGSFRFSVDEYRSSFTELVSRQRSIRQLPVAVVDLRDHLGEEHYLDDGFHPNALGHEVVGRSGLPIGAAAGTSAQPATK
ncbi:MAG: hypothetical protein WCI22_14565 [Actinomycetota bacterium]